MLNIGWCLTAIVVRLSIISGFGNLGPKRLLASSTLPVYGGPVEGVLLLLTKQDMKKLEAAETGELNSSFYYAAVITGHQGQAPVTESSGVSLHLPCRV